MKTSGGLKYFASYFSIRLSRKNIIFGDKKVKKINFEKKKKMFMIDNIEVNITLYHNATETRRVFICS